MIAVVLVNSLVILSAVIIHYEFLSRMTILMPEIKIRHRFRIVIGVCGALVAHTLEVWLFAFAYYFMHGAKGWGYFDGNFNGSLMDCVYFSFSTTPYY